MVEQLLAAGAALDFEVRGGGGRGKGRAGEQNTALRVLLGFLALCFSNFGVTLASRISKGIGHVATV